MPDRGTGVANYVFENLIYFVAIFTGWMVPGPEYPSQGESADEKPARERERESSRPRGHRGVALEHPVREEEEPEQRDDAHLGRRPVGY